MGYAPTRLIPVPETVRRSARLVSLHPRLSPHGRHAARLLTTRASVSRQFLSRIAQEIEAADPIESAAWGGGAARAWIRRVYLEERLACPDPVDLRPLLPPSLALVESTGPLPIHEITLAGPGSGQEHLATMRRTAAPVVSTDHGLSPDYDTIIRSVHHALSTGRSVALTYLHTNPIETYEESILPQIIKTGVPAPVDAHVDGHRQAQQTFKKLSRTYLGTSDPRVSLSALDVSDRTKDPAPADMRLLRDLPLHSRSELQAGCNHVLDRAHAEGTLSDRLRNQCRSGDQPGG
jgi:hypothetical protein